MAYIIEYFSVGGIRIYKQQTYIILQEKQFKTKKLGSDLIAISKKK